jgi:hypothetical protein
MNMKPITLCTLLAAAMLAGGCATGRGDRQADQAPRLVERNNVIAWDRGDAFGPVPLRLSSLAAINCATLDTKDLKWEPEGFHARALDLDGRTLPGGGYYCKSRKRSGN